MKIRIFVVATLFFAKLFFAQETIVYDAYPPGREAYVGGKKQLYKEIHDVLIEKEFQKCEDSTQSYKVNLIVKNDASILFIQNPDSVYVEKNKCAYELSKKILPHLKNWKPAEHKKKKLNAIYEFEFTPVDLFENYKENYTGKDQNRLLNELISKEKTNLTIEEGYIKGVAIFSVGAKGEIADIKVTTAPHNPEVEKEMISTIKKMARENKFPKNNPQRFRLPFKIVLD
ncbi:MAG: hypothetical protein LBE36_08850 [Flavobacteriaceae bacterium]|jgi:hypothetical protein|nr:hypothetical protein [Flavobacteriaceae bacterium]